LSHASAPPPVVAEGEQSQGAAPRSTSSLAVLTLGAIGVVYGDIGTSPLYALKQVFASRSFSGR